jgi:hypothetical protein
MLDTGADGRFSLVVYFRGLHCPAYRKQVGELDRRLGDPREAGVGRVLAASMETLERSAQLVQEWLLDGLPVAHGLSEASAPEWGLFVSTAIKDGEAPVFNEPGMFVLDADGRPSTGATCPRCHSGARPSTTCSPGCSSRRSSTTRTEARPEPRHR